MARTRWLEDRGFRVLRFWPHQGFIDLDGVLDTIHAAIVGDGPHP